MRSSMSGEVAGLVLKLRQEMDEGGGRCFFWGGGEGKAGKHVVFLRFKVFLLRTFLAY